MKNRQTSLPYIVSRFFTVYLPGERGFSEATIISYRDTFKQLLSFCKSHLGIHPDKLTVNDLSRNLITEFLKFLEAEGKTVSTQNQRLAAIKCFFGYIQYAFPEYLDVASGVLQIRMKKQPEPAVNYMSVDGVASVLRQPDMNSHHGFRDTLMMTILYDSGARVSEITKIHIGDIRLHPPCNHCLARKRK